MKLHRMPYGSFTHPDDPGEPGTGKPRISITAKEGHLLARLASELKVLEIGTGLGVSTRALANTAYNVITIDIDPWVKEHIAADLPDNVEFFDRRVIDQFDMVFVDGLHTFEQACDDIWYAQEMCDHGWVVVHDTNIEDVQRACEHFEDFHMIPTTHGMGIKFRGWE